MTGYEVYIGIGFSSITLGVILGIPYGFYRGATKKPFEIPLPERRDTYDSLLCLAKFSMYPTYLFTYGAGRALRWGIDKIAEEGCKWAFAHSPEPLLTETSDFSVLPT